MNDIFSALEQQLAILNGTTSFIPSISVAPQPSGLNGIPPVSDITVATFNHFDNGPAHKTKWSSSRYAMNLQFFTQTAPFTPSAGLAAWKGTVQLLEPDFWFSYVEFKHDEGKIDAETFAYLRAAYETTLRNYPGNVLLGTFTDKNSGTHYSWPYFVRFFYDKFEEANLEVWLDEQLPTIIAWEPVPQVPDQFLPIIRSRYNPHNLWKSGRPMGGKGKKHKQ
ncbi:hypothetical protein [Microvirga tunisiensis]|uniref:Uncharacterized protein n=1 Tax=Microvirga tunisiensis TaxID=2108360 RepID=A0A5N7MSJ4_9HYPH|nr:hypothetical protein [Microvirga tunisiensis]MPR11805.1 hypothetical protein [Microvirga tunisiensis]MPR29838.1 hypothetical protein [Microvirga tunisiensis]